MSIAALLALLLAPQEQEQARTPIGIYGSWGAFADAAPRRCYAIAQPVQRSSRAARPFASVASWPDSGVRGQLHLRLSRTRAANARVTLAVGERRFELVAGEVDAWAPDARTDAAIVAAIREGRSMSVETVGADGRPFADSYALTGAASAIDAATLACIARRR